VRKRFSTTGDFPSITQQPNHPTAAPRIPFGKAAWQHINVHTPDAASIARRDSIPAGLTRKGRQENSRTFFSNDISCAMA
jgi:hypothetical protein